MFAPIQHAGHAAQALARAPTAVDVHVDIDDVVTQLQRLNTFDIDRREQHLRTLKSVLLDDEHYPLAQRAQAAQAIAQQSAFAISRPEVPGPPCTRAQYAAQAITLSLHAWREHALLSSDQYDLLAQRMNTWLNVAHADEAVEVYDISLSRERITEALEAVVRLGAQQAQREHYDAAFQARFDPALNEQAAWGRWQSVHWTLPEQLAEQARNAMQERVGTVTLSADDACAALSTWIGEQQQLLRAQGQPNDSRLSHANNCLTAYRRWQDGHQRIIDTLIPLLWTFINATPDPAKRDEMRQALVSELSEQLVARTCAGGFRTRLSSALLPYDSSLAALAGAYEISAITAQRINDLATENLERMSEQLENDETRRFIHHQDALQDNPYRQEYEQRFRNQVWLECCVFNGVSMEQLQAPIANAQQGFEVTPPQRPSAAYALDALREVANLQGPMEQRIRAVRSARTMYERGRQQEAAATAQRYMIQLARTQQAQHHRPPTPRADQGVTTAATAQPIRALFDAIIAGSRQTVAALLAARPQDKDAVNNEGQHPLHVAALNNRVAVIYELLDRGVDIEVRSNYGPTPLNIAASEGQVDAINGLLARGANINDPHCSALLDAAANGHIDAVNALLVAPGVNIDMRTHHNDTPLMAAARKGQVDIINTLLARGADVNIIHKRGYSALAWAVDEGHLNAVNALLASPSLEIDGHPFFTSDATEPLNIAAFNGRVDIINALLAHVLDLKKYDTALIWAARAGRVDAINELLNRSTNIEARSNDGLTPLNTAALNGHVDAINTLLAHGADLNTTDNFGYTALFSAARGGHVGAINELLDRGMSIEARLNTGSTPLNIAACHGQADAINALLARGAAINAADNEERTALFNAAVSGSVDAVNALLAAPGVNIEARSKSGLTPLHVAALHGQRRDIIDALLARGAAIT